MKIQEVKVSGVSGGVGTMLIPSKLLGCKILGNLEYRKPLIYNTPNSTFEKYFNAELKTDYEDIDFIKNSNIIFIQDDCLDNGKLKTSFNRTKNGVKKERTPKKDYFYRSMSVVKKISPDFFVIDNNPKLLLKYNAEYWKTFTEYDITFEYVSNYHYGNIQKGRNRLIIIGSKKKYNFKFIPDERFYNWSLTKTLENCENLPNHYPLDPNAEAKHFQNVLISDNETVKYYKDLKRAFEYCKFKQLLYRNKNNEIKTRISCSPSFEKYSKVVIGGWMNFHPVTFIPTTIRERARIQGFPDDFVFQIPKEMHFKDIAFKQVAKAIPFQFMDYLTKLILTYLTDYKLDFNPSKQRYGKISDIVEKTKIEYKNNFEEW